ncbi:response regulator transcription factor [Microcoleus sp. FACHB-1515]|uniref:response regulator n=1 Tax=Cyanophyceae TaxID=3028117 RepID=UPI00168A3838|nr:response regulator transcription factor [Microcoleus sp. FACHB-1515]MBD2091947.1 response regulator transcription factor [Microcoleus sp. FACHB-1515]
MLSHRSPNLRVLVVDDHELIRYSLKMALQRQPNIELVGLASNGKEAVEMVKQHRPDVVILDLQMPIVDGLSASLQIKGMYPQTQIVAYSSVKDPQVEVMVQTAQVDAFCEKEVPIQELINVVTQLGRAASSRQQ